MLTSIESLLHVFSKLYFLQIDLEYLRNTDNLQVFTLNYFYLIFFLSLFHSIIILIIANLSNTYRHFRYIFFSVLYSIFIAFSIGKILETMFSIFLHNLPFAGTDLAIFNTYSSLAIFYIIEIVILKGKLKSLYDRGKLESEAIDSDILLGVTISTLLTILLFIIVN